MKSLADGTSRIADKAFLDDFPTSDSTRIECQIMSVIFKKKGETPRIYLIGKRVLSLTLADGNYRIIGMLCLSLLKRHAQFPPQSPTRDADLPWTDVEQIMAPGSLFRPYRVIKYIQSPYVTIFRRHVPCRSYLFAMNTLFSSLA